MGPASRLSSTAETVSRISVAARQSAVASASSASLAAVPQHTTVRKKSKHPSVVLSHTISVNESGKWRQGGQRTRTAVHNEDHRRKGFEGGPERINGNALQDAWQDPTAAQSFSSFASQSRKTEALARPSVLLQIPRKEGVTEGVWDRHDVEAVREALQSCQPQNSSEKALLGRSLEEVQQIAVAEGYLVYRGKQLYEGILRGAKSLADVSNIPKAMREELGAKGYTTGRSALQQCVEAQDGTRKFLLQVRDGRVVEAVGIPNEKDSRLTACVSSQVGCPMRCTFCATGKGGFARNLQAHEIVDQVLTIQEQFGMRVSNVVFMGMGEPLLNLRSVVAANSFISSDIGIGARHITISTVGVPNAIMKLASLKLQNTLAVSIHAPTQQLRETIVPSARMYPLEALMMDCRKYFEVTGRRITFEYTLMAGINDGIQQARQLAGLLSRFDLRAHVNVIPWNPVEESEFQRPTKAAVRAFAAALSTAGVTNSTRITRGIEAAAACGQLRNQHQKEPLPQYTALG